MTSITPTIIQNHITKEVLMLGYSTSESIELTEKTGVVHFYSRSKQRLWKKGETSGNEFRLISKFTDCDQDTLLFLVEPKGPACHTGSRTCFNEFSTVSKIELDSKLKNDFQPEKKLGVFERLYTRVLFSKNLASQNINSRTAEELKKPTSYHIRKLNEEACEIGLAIAYESLDRVENEVADLLYRLSLILINQNIHFDQIEKVLKSREHKA